jgi:hypothetical protein
LLLADNRSFSTAACLGTRLIVAPLPPAFPGQWACMEFWDALIINMVLWAQPFLGAYKASAKTGRGWVVLAHWYLWTPGRRASAHTIIAAAHHAWLLSWITRRVSAAGSKDVLSKIATLVASKQSTTLVSHQGSINCIVSFLVGAAFMVLFRCWKENNNNNDEKKTIALFVARNTIQQLTIKQ